MNEQIDWSKAPVDATHYDADPERTGSYMKLEDGAWFFWPPFSETPAWNLWDRHGKMDRSKIIPRPQTPTWNGPEDGLPPVGTVCELRSRNGGWGEAEIKYHGRAICVWLWVRRDGNTDQVEWAEGPDRLEFRPIRTAEQLAAEAHRAKYMPQLIKLWDADTGRTEFLEAVYAMIAEARLP